MNTPIGLTIYKSSAGSGKTFTLVLSYLKIVVRRPDLYKNILAITFTNKATEEMKTRIINTLSDLAAGEKNTYYHKLKEHYNSLNLKNISIRKNAEKALNNILKDYSGFSVSTIESFCQRVIRAFAKELNLPLGYDIEMRRDKVLQVVVDELIMEAGKAERDYLTQALTDFLDFEIEQDSDWKIEKKIRIMAEEIFKENYQKLASFNLDENTEKYVTLISEIKQKIEETINFVRSEMKKMGNEGVEYIENNRVDENNFAGKTRSPLKYFRSLTQKGASKDEYEKFYNKKHYQRPAEDWVRSDLKKETEKTAALYSLNIGHATFLSTLFDKIGGFYLTHETEYLTAIHAQKTIQTLRLMDDLRRKLADYRRENRQMMISDTNILLKGILESSEDVPFVYEKLGNRYAFYLIDEFQDTSDMQWENLLPLVLNAVSSVPWEGNMIVGDVKQSIYRWRGGAFELLLHKVEKRLRENGQIVQVRNLQDNWRTAHKIVEFNNALFEKSKEILARDESGEYAKMLRSAYGDVHQFPQKQNIAGYTRINFIEYKNSTEKNNAVFQLLEDMLKEIKEAGFLFKDVMILVRKNKDAATVAGFLQKKQIKVTSSESMILESSPAVKMLIAVLYYLIDETNLIAAATAAYYYQIFQNPQFVYDLSGEEIMPDSEALIALFQNPKYNLPSQLEAARAELLRLPLYETAERLIRFFPELQYTDAYIQGLLDTIMGFYKQNEGGLAEFLEWWEEIKNTTYVISAPDPDAINLMTIHKAKGLEFPVVIIPFCDWPIFPNSGSVFWVNSSINPYNQSDIYPLKYSDELENTHFVPHFQEERFLSVFDNLNLLYVALTRPQYRLYCITPLKFTKEERDGEVKIKTIGKLMFAALAEIGEGKSETALEYVFGKKNTYSEILEIEGNKPQEVRFPSVSDNYHPIYDWSDILRIKTHKNKIYKASLQELEEKIQIGNLLHETLQYIYVKEDIPYAISKMILEGIIPKEKEQEYHERLHQIVSFPPAAAWFSGVGVVKNETEIMTNRGEVLRPDKIIIDGNKVSIIDYKTGSYTSEHKTQLALYQTCMNELGFNDVKGYLYYILANKVVAIES